MPTYKPSFVKVKGEEEKKGEKTIIPTMTKKLEDKEFEATAKSRVMDTPNSLIQGICKLLDTTRWLKLKDYLVI